MKKTNQKVCAALCAMALAVAMPAQLAIAEEDTTATESVANEAVPLDAENRSMLAQDADIPNDATTSEPRTSVDRTYRFDFSFVGATQATPARQKEDETSSYIRIDNKTIRECNVYIDGAYDIDGSYVNRTINRSTGQAGGSATVTSTGQFQIYNNVYETGRRWAKLTGWAAGYTGWMEGWWSPDCIGCNRYPVINNY